MYYFSRKFNIIRYKREFTLSSINVKEPYLIKSETIKLKDFHEKKDFYVKRPPYQRKTVWDYKKQAQLIDSFIRAYYVPGIVLRRVDFSKGRYKYEVVDGQQRINSIQNFFDDKFPLPNSLRDILENEVNKKYSELSEELQNLMQDRTLNSDVIRMIEDPKNKKNQKLVTQVFYRLQQGEDLTYIEEEHSKLYSAVRNFIVKYADDISFDWSKYIHLNTNSNRHPFFKIIERSNDRMEHLSLLVRFLLIEKDRGPTNLSYTVFSDFFNRYEDVLLPDFESLKWVKNCKRMLDLMYQIFKDDILVQASNTVKEFSQEYFIISIYLLLRHLKTKNYTFGKRNYEDFRSFIYNFYQRWRNADPDDKDIFIFRDNRQQDKDSISNRDQIIKEIFFSEYPEMKHTDPQRIFTEAQRIAIYRRDRGFCQECLSKGKTEEEAFVSWNDYEADHMHPYHKGGETKIKNGQLLCKECNRKKGGR